MARWNFGKVVVIFRVTPTVSSSAEQSFSVLRRPKTNLKSTKAGNRLGHLAVLRIKYAYLNRVDIEKITDQFSSKKGRSKLNECHREF